MSSIIDTITTLGEAPNNTIAQGIINNAIVQGITTSKWNIRSGGDSQTIFKGTQDQIVAAAQSCQRLGYEYSIIGGHVWSITITFPVDIVVNSLNSEPTPLTIWELTFVPIKQNTLEASDRVFISRLSTATKHAISKQLNLNTNVSPVELLGTDQKVSGKAPGLSAEIAYKLKQIGVEGRNIFVPTLKRSAIMSNKYVPNTTANIINQQAPWDQTTNGKLFTTTELIQKYATTGNPFQNMPTFIQKQLPSTIICSQFKSVGTLDTISPMYGYTIDGNGIVTFVGWLEYPPEYQTISLTKVQATQHWQFQKWSAGTYGLYDPALPSEGPGPSPSQPVGPLNFNDNMTV